MTFGAEVVAQHRRSLVQILSATSLNKFEPILIEKKTEMKGKVAENGPSSKNVTFSKGFFYMALKVVVLFDLVLIIRKKRSL